VTTIFHADYDDYADFIYNFLCRHESYVPQKLSYRWKFSRHKWLLTYLLSQESSLLI